VNYITSIPEDQEDVISLFKPFVNNKAISLAKSCKSLTVDDLTQVGFVAIMECFPRLNRTQPIAQQIQYIRTWVEGRMRREIRNKDNLITVFRKRGVHAFSVEPDYLGNLVDPDNPRGSNPEDIILEREDFKERVEIVKRAIDTAPLSPGELRALVKKHALPSIRLNGSERQQLHTGMNKIRDAVIEELNAEGD
jgi:hypothetical protein